MAKRPKMPSRLRVQIYERDGYACRHCGWAPPVPDGYRGHAPIRLVGSWTDRCTCAHNRGRHRHAEHTAIDIGRGLACSGRNHGGGCRDCDCELFNHGTNRAKEAA